MSGAQKPSHICYYSNRCQWSRAFITEIGQTPWKGLFHYVCVDPAAGRPPLPGWLKKVPTLVLAGDPEPKTDSDVMNWLYEKKMMETQNVAKGSATAPAASMGGEPDPWSIAEQSSFSKGFGYSGIDVDTSAQGNGGESIPGSFSFLNGGASVGDRSQSSSYNTTNDSGRKKTKKEELFDKQMEAYQREREVGTPRGPARAL